MKRDELAVILPEATVRDADHVYRRLQHAISTRTGGAKGLHLSAGVAGSVDDDPVSLFERADTALFRAKQNGNGRVVTDLGSAAGSTR